MINFFSAFLVVVSFMLTSCATKNQNVGGSPVMPNVPAVVKIPGSESPEKYESSIVDQVAFACGNIPTGLRLMWKMREIGKPETTQFFISFITFEDFITVVIEYVQVEQNLTPQSVWIEYTQDDIAEEYFPSAEEFKKQHPYENDDLCPLILEIRKNLNKTPAAEPETQKKPESQPLKIW
jgi:hypothetical protein